MTKRECSLFIFFEDGGTCASDTWFGGGGACFLDGALEGALKPLLLVDATAFDACVFGAHAGLCGTVEFAFIDHDATDAYFALAVIFGIGGGGAHFTACGDSFGGACGFGALDVSVGGQAWGRATCEERQEQEALECFVDGEHGVYFPCKKKPIVFCSGLATLCWLAVSCLESNEPPI